MPGFRLHYAKSVRKDIKDIDIAHLKKIKKEIEKLIDFPDTKNIKKLTHHPVADYTLRIGDYRVLFDVDPQDSIINILKIGHRKDIY
ncbi:MAG: type II toxin-antitoxin system RelE/ParE family toxin [Acidobacteria bacterium]|jgi:mRNA interferase RelE/StbE|nr:type II toxin-antitoxin system RelE/ParE family toxin [Acidobacteriota bacterium]